MKAYYFFEVDRFDLFAGANIISTPQQLVVGDQIEKFSEPRTEVRLATDNFYQGFNRMVFEHENKSKKRKIRTYGDTAFNEFIPQNSFVGYYNSDIKVLILQTSKSNAREAIKRLTKYFPDKISVEQGHVNYPHIIQRVDNVWGGWIGGLNYGNLKSAGLFGDHVNLSEDFDRFSAAGKLSCLNVQLEFDRRTLDFMITKDRGVVFLSRLTDEEELDILIQLRPILYDNLS